MATYKELCETYKKRQYDNLVDTIAAGVSHVDTFALDLDLFDGLGDIAEVLEQISLTLPFIIITATEGTKVILGKKKASKGLKDAGVRAAKSGVAIAAGAGAAAIAGGFVAIPAAVSVRLIIDRYRSKTMLGRRLDDRTKTLRFLNEKWRVKSGGFESATQTPATVI